MSKSFIPEIEEGSYAEYDLDCALNELGKIALRYGYHADVQFWDKEEAEQRHKFIEIERRNKKKHLKNKHYENQN